AGRWPVDDAPSPRLTELEDYRAVLVATAAGTPRGMIEAASHFLERHDGSRFAPSARYARAIGRDLAGHHEEARDALAVVARDKSSVGRHVASPLASRARRTPRTSMRGSPTRTSAPATTAAP